jgi:hypothetical protein
MPPYPHFPLETDYEVYCYLKAHLPKDFAVTATPNTSYYSEWQFNYTVTRANEVVAQFKGDFREIQPGSLIEQALALVTAIAPGKTRAPPAHVDR